MLFKEFSISHANPVDFSYLSGNQPPKAQFMWPIVGLLLWYSLDLWQDGLLEIS